MQCACVVIDGQQYYCCQHQQGKKKVKDATHFTISVDAQGKHRGVQSWMYYYVNIHNMSKEAFFSKEKLLLETFGREFVNIFDTIEKSFIEEGDALDKALSDNQVSIVFDAKTSQVNFNKQVKPRMGVMEETW